MKYILNYHTQQEVEEKEGIASISGMMAGSDFDWPYETDTIAEISGVYNIRNKKKTYEELIEI